MDSAAMELQTPLKGKLHQVKYLLDDANKRLHEEMSKCEIFTTKTSATACSSNLNKQNNNNTNNKAELPTELSRTISDISTLNSVLSCPIFNRIVNVADSLDKLSYHLNLHPSIGPSDINIDANGELILAPPIEPTSLNYLINTKGNPKVNDYMEHSNLSSIVMNSNLVQNNNNNNQTFVDDQDQLRQQNLKNLSNFNSQQQASDIGFVSPHSINPNEQLANNINQQQQQQASAQANYVQPMNVYDNEKLVSNRTSTAQNGHNKAKRFQQDPIRKADELDGNDECQKVHRSNGQFNYDNRTKNSCSVDYEPSNLSQIGQTDKHLINSSTNNGYPNELYKNTHELNQADSLLSEQPGHHISTNQTNGQSNDPICLKNNNQNNFNQTFNGRSSQTNAGVLNYNRSSCSPSTSAGSTVRLADECDSGASSLNQPPLMKNGNNPYSPHVVYKMNVGERVTADEGQTVTADDNKLDSMEPDLPQRPELERIKVTLEKDESGIGITVAGYTCEKQEISGIFIKSITPGSPADRSGKVKTLDQIFAVDGRELLGYNNKEAVKVLKHTGAVVTLELLRYLADDKFQKLQTAISRAVSITNNKSENAAISSQNNTTPDIISSPMKSAIPVAKSPTKPPLLAKPSALVQLSKNQQQQQQQVTPAATAAVPPQTLQQNVESIYKNDIVPTKTTEAAPAKRASKSQVNSPLSPDLHSHIPVAAQRGNGTSKVIETKQGARNTIDIRSPVYQTTSPTYVNKIVSNDQYDSTTKKVSPTNTGRIQNDASDDLGRLFRSQEPKWETDIKIIDISKDSTQSLGFTVKDYKNPKDQNKSIIMITALTPGGIAEKDGRLSSGDLLAFVDATNLEGATLNEAVRALKKTSGTVNLGVLKLKRT